MITMVVARLKRPVYDQQGQIRQDPLYMDASHFFADSSERALLQQLGKILQEEIVLMVLFPGGWTGKKPRAEDVTERVSNFMTLHPDPAFVVGGATACNFFALKLYSKYMGTCNRDFGVAIYPAPHFEDLVNSDNVNLGDLVLALIKCQAENRKDVRLPGSND